VWNTSAMRRTVAALAFGSLLLAACGSDDSNVDTITTEPATTEAASAPTTAPAVTDTTVTEAAALDPEVVCQGDGGEIYFGYTNESSEPVAVEEGDANRLSGVASDSNPLLTTLFVPGTVEIAFWAFPPEGSAEGVAWTLTGPDGVERTAVGGPTTDLCPDFDADELMVEVAGFTLAADGESVDVDLRVTGLDETSVCNEVLVAEPRLVAINDGSVLPTSFEPEATITLGPFAEVSGVGRSASTNVFVLVLEQCSGAGVTATSWSPDLLPYARCLTVRFDDDGALIVEELGFDGCRDLPLVGGVLIRPR
jgi:hypothetical protein